MREREGGRGGGTRPEKTAGATHPKTTQRQPEAAQLNAYAKLKAIRSRKRAPGWAERAFAMFKNVKKKKKKKKNRSLLIGPRAPPWRPGIFADYNK